MWPGVRVFGYGATRPVFVLAADTPGFQKAGRDGDVHRRPRRPGAAAGGGCACRFRRRTACRRITTIADANPGTFYSAMSNIDFEIGRRQSGGRGDPLSRRAARLSEPHGLPYRLRPGGADQVGNEAEDLHFYGGRYGILTDKHVAALAVHADRFRVSRASARPRSASTRRG